MSHPLTTTNKSRWGARAACNNYEDHLSSSFSYYFSSSSSSSSSPTLSTLSTTMDMHSPIQFAAYTPSPSPPPSASSAGGLVQRRQRVTIACAYCRRRKIKCDGKERCSNCNRLKQPCIYTKCSSSTGAGILAISPSAISAKKDPSKKHRKHHSLGANEGILSSSSWNEYAHAQTTFQSAASVDPTSLYAVASNALADVARPNPASAPTSSSSFQLIDINASSLTQRRKKAGYYKTAPTSIPTSGLPTPGSIPTPTSDDSLLIHQMAQLRSQSASPHASHFYLPPTPDSYQYSPDSAPESYQYTPDSTTDSSAYYYEFNSKPSSDLLYQSDYQGHAFDGHSAPPNMTEFNVIDQSCNSSPSSDEQSEDQESNTLEPSLMPPIADMHDMLLFSGAPAPFKEADASWLGYLQQTPAQAQHGPLYPLY